MRRFIWETFTVSDSQLVTSNCADIYFFTIEKTAGVITINGLPLIYGVIFHDTAFGDEMNETQYNIVIAAGSGAVLFVKRKIYLG